MESSPATPGFWPGLEGGREIEKYSFISIRANLENAWLRELVPETLKGCRSGVQNRMALSASRWLQSFTIFPSAPKLIFHSYGLLAARACPVQYVPAAGGPHLPCAILFRQSPLSQAGMAELADAADSKSADRKVVGVRPPLPAPRYKCFKMIYIEWTHTDPKCSSSALTPKSSFRELGRGTTPQQDSLSGVIICPACWSGQRLRVNSFTTTNGPVDPCSDPMSRRRTQRPGAQFCRRVSVRMRRTVIEAQHCGLGDKDNSSSSQLRTLGGDTTIGSNIDTAMMPAMICRLLA